jgi:5-bromo-4-chloroindolyl phosphate hydrolysis protein
MLASDEGDLLEDRKMDDPSKHMNEVDLNQIDFKAIQETLERAKQEEDVKMEEPS